MDGIAEALQDALANAETLPDGPLRDRLMLDLTFALTTPLIVATGYSSPQTEIVFARLSELARKVGAARDVFPVLYGRWVHPCLSG